MSMRYIYTDREDSETLNEISTSCCVNSRLKSGILNTEEAITDNKFRVAASSKDGIGAVNILYRYSVIIGQTD